jgi:hypothetical protein
MVVPCLPQLWQHLQDRFTDTRVFPLGLNRMTKHALSIHTLYIRCTYSLLNGKTLNMNDGHRLMHVKTQYILAEAPGVDRVGN